MSIGSIRDYLPITKEKAQLSSPPRLPNGTAPSALYTSERSNGSRLQQASPVWMGRLDLMLALLALKTADSCRMFVVQIHQR